MLKMTGKEINEKVDELRTEMIKARAASKKSGKSNLKTLKKIIARLMTVRNLNKIKNIDINNANKSKIQEAKK